MTEATRSRGNPLTLIVNPDAGGGKGRPRAFSYESALDLAGVPFRSIITRSLDHAASLAREALERGELPVAVGGDGLAASIGGAIAGGGGTMGILPAGRGNDLARGLGIPSEVDGAVECLLSGAPRAIDVGLANGRTFLGIASVGFDSRANEIANRTRWIRGRPVYLVSALRALIGWKPVRFTVTFGDRSGRIMAHTVAVANNRYYGAGMMMAPDADIADGQLDLVIVGAANRLRFLIDIRKVFDGSHVLTDSVEVHRSSSITISGPEDLVVYADGDPLTSLPAEFRVLRQALTVLVPKESISGG